MTGTQEGLHSSADIGAALDGFAAAYNASDASRLAAAFEPDAIFVNIAAGRADGRPAIKAMHAQAFRSALRGTVIEFLAVEHRMLEPAVALAHVEWRVTTTEATPSALPRTGILIFVLRQTKDRWWIAAAQNTQTGALPLVETRQS